VAARELGASQPRQGLGQGLQDPGLHKTPTGALYDNSKDDKHNNITYNNRSGSNNIYIIMMVIIIIV